MTPAQISQLSRILKKHAVGNPSRPAGPPNSTKAASHEPPNSLQTMTLDSATAATTSAGTSSAQTTKPERIPRARIPEVVSSKPIPADLDDQIATFRHPNRRRSTGNTSMMVRLSFASTKT